MHSLLKNTRRRRVLASRAHEKEKEKRLHPVEQARRVHEDATIHKSPKTNYSRSLPAKSLEQMVANAVSKHGSDAMKPSIEAMKKLADLEDQVSKHRLETKDIRLRIDATLRERKSGGAKINGTLLRARVEGIISKCISLSSDRDEALKALGNFFSERQREDERRYLCSRKN